MGLTKQQLEILNNSSFPNNNAGYITPEILRNFNSSSIAATVNQDTYTADSASFDTRIDSLENFSSSLVTNFATVAYVNSVSSSLVSTASFNSYTQSTTAIINGLATTSSVNTLTASINNVSTSVGLLQTFSGSQYKADSASFSSRIDTAGNTGYVTTASFNSYTQSTDTKINSLNTISASYLSFTSSYYTDSASVSSRLNRTATTGSNTFNGNQIVNGNISASSFISASNFVGNGSQLTGITASVSIAILDEGIYQGNATSLNFTGSALSASVVAGVAVIQATIDQSVLNQYTLTSSFNSFTSSYYTDSASFNSRINSVSTASFVNTASFNAYTASNDSKVNALIAATGSYITNSQTASMAVSSSTYAITSSYAVNAQTASEARNVIVIARNGNQSTLPAGTVVHITSASGDNPIFNTASFDVEALSSNTLGILRSTLTSGADGEVVVNGIVTGVDTNPANGYAAGDLVYLSSSGQFTRVQPQAPNQIVTLGQVLRAQQNQGSIYVSINNGWELNELHNVLITNPQQNDILSYVSGAYGLWENKSISTLGLTTTSSFNSFTSSTNTFTASISTSVGLLQTFSGSQYKADSASFSSRINAITSSGTINTGSFATTGSNSFVGNQTITGSVLISSSAALDLIVSGAIQIIDNFGNGTLNGTGFLINNTSTNFGLSAGGSGISNFNNVTGDEIGFTADPGGYGITNGVGNTIYVNDPTDSFPAIINFQNKANWTDGRTNFLTPISASAGITASNAFLNGALYSVTSASFNSRINAITGSGTINTGSFATTGSNTFNGNQTITGSVFVKDGNEISLGTINGTIFNGISLKAYGTNNVNKQIVTYASQSAEMYFGTIGAGFEYDSELAIINTPNGTQFQDWDNNANAYSTFLTVPYNTGTSLPTFNRGLVVSGSASFTQLTGSLASYSASVDSRIKVAATTGSNNFVGNQTITGSLILSSSAAVELQVIGGVEITGSVAGNITALTVASSTASIDFSRGTFFTLTIPSASVTYITGSNLKSGMTANIILTQQATTGSVRFESSLFKFPSGSINTGSAVANAVDMVSVAAINTTTLYSVTARQLQ